ncbi:MAG: hypothetical protein JWL76_735 [Thermoleophilia bacterium]|nr:hypothetical protein [Thermoleophilia bacterium]
MSGTSVIDVATDPAHVAVPGEGEHAGDFSHAAFVRWLLAATLVAVGAVAAVNWYIDPTGVTGRSTKWLVAENSEVRSAKLDLYEAALAGDDTAPEIVLLGSSRTMKFDPQVVERLTDARAFNAAVSGGVPRDAWLFVKLIEARQGETFPHLVWGLDADAFRDKQLRDGLSTDPRMARFVSRGERIATRVASAGTLTELQTLTAALRSVTSNGADGQAPRESRFSASGMQLWSLPFGKTRQFRERLIRKEIAMYAGFIFERDSYDGIEQDPLDDFTDAIRIANEHGDVPTIFLTPYHPLAEELLDRYGIDERADEVRVTLRRLQREGDVEFEFVDLSSLASFGGDPAQFYDGIHMTPKNTARALARLQRDGVLAGS